MSLIRRDGAAARTRTPFEEAEASGARSDGDEAAAALYADIQEAPPRAMLTLRADLSETAAAEAVHAAMREAERLGPPAPLTCRSDGARGVYWMAPDELLLCAPYGEIDDVYERMSTALAAIPHLLVDVSDARQVLVVSGAGAREVLAKGSPIDLHPDAFGLGAFRRSRLAGVAAAVAMIGERPDRFELFCARSYAVYVRRWVTSSAAADAEIGVLRR